MYMYIYVYTKVHALSHKQSQTYHQIKDRHYEGYTVLDIHITHDDFDVLTENGKLLGEYGVLHLCCSVLLCVAVCCSLCASYITATTSHHKGGD